MQPRDIRQSDNWSCGACCIESITGTRPDVGNPKRGTTTNELLKWFRKQDCHVSQGEQWDVQDLKYHTSRGRHVICHVRDWGGHWVVVWKVGRGKVHYHDPSKGPRVSSEEDFVSVWTQLAIAVVCDPGTELPDLSGGEPQLPLPPG